MKTEEPSLEALLAYEKRVAQTNEPPSEDPKPAWGRHASKDPNIKLGKHSSRKSLESICTKGPSPEIGRLKKKQQGTHVQEGLPPRWTAKEFVLTMVAALVSHLQWVFVSIVVSVALVVVFGSGLHAADVGRLLAPSVAALKGFFS